MVSRAHRIQNLATIMLTGLAVLCGTLVAQETGGGRDDGQKASELGSTATLEELGKNPSEAKSPGDGQPQGSTRNSDEEAPKRLRVRAAAEPKTALQYRFWPSSDDLKAGDAQTHFYRAVLLVREMSSEAETKVGDWSGLSVEQLPAEEVNDFLASQGNVYDELRRMAYSENQHYDMHIRDLEGTKVYYFLLPEIQEARQLARMLQIQANLQIKNRDYDGAIDTCRIMFRLAKFVGSGETLVQQLVGIAIAAISLNTVEQIVAQPDSPNLYWALATLPRPLIDIRQSLELEGGSLLRSIPVLKDAATRNLTSDQWRKELIDSVASLQDLSGDMTNASKVMGAVAIINAMGDSESELRKRLLRRGWTEEKLATMSLYQKIAIDAAEDIAYWRDRYFSVALLPLHLSEPLFLARKKEFEEWTKENKNRSLGATVAGLLSPAVHAAQKAVVRSQYFINRLMTIEALRMHAANESGRLPDTLSDLAVVPALDDPFASRPFLYKIERSDTEQVVTLSGKTPSEWPDWLMEITLIFPPTGK